jgi:RNA polymerase sigma factor (sigma-70 family)
VEHSPTDAELVGLARSGEAAAFAGLFERHRPALYAVAVSILRNREDALDAVQDTCLTALTRLDSLREPDAVRGWLHAILRNACAMKARRGRRETLRAEVEGSILEETPEEMLADRCTRDWVWTALETLSPEDRLTVLLRYFTRCRSYQAIADVTAVPIGTVRSRLHRARSHLATELRQTLDGTWSDHADLQARRREQWEHFYTDVHAAPVAGTYRDVYAPDVSVRDTVACWHGRVAWAEHEREAITLGVRAHIVGVHASRDLAVLEVDFANPAWAADHCPPRSTFVHRLRDGRSHRLDIVYV